MNDRHSIKEDPGSQLFETGGKVSTSSTIDTVILEPDSGSTQAMEELATTPREKKDPNPSPADTVILLPSGDSLRELEKDYKAKSPETSTAISCAPGCVPCMLGNRLPVPYDIPEI